MKTVELICPSCHDPEGISVTLDYCSGVTELGILSGWSALEVEVRCGCELREHQRQALASQAEERMEVGGFSREALLAAQGDAESGNYLLAEDFFRELRAKYSGEDDQ